MKRCRLLFDQISPERIPVLPGCMVDEGLGLVLGEFVGLELINR